MNRPQVAYFLSGVLAHFPSGTRTVRQRFANELDADTVLALQRGCGRGPTGLMNDDPADDFHVAALDGQLPCSVNPSVGDETILVYQ
jgi:hypothetical protein